METMVSNNLPSVVAAVELETALQRQRGLVDAFMLDGGQPGWLNDLDRAKPSLAHWLAEAKRTARTDEERKTLAMLTAVYKSYDEERERAITLYQEGHALEARRVLLRDVSLLSNQADDLCRQLVASNQLYINTSMRQGHRQVAALALVLAAGVGLAILLSLSLVLIVFRRFLLPVRRLAQDAKAFSDDRSPAGRASFQDEFHELEFYSRALMSDVARTRTDLEESERRLLVAEKLAAVGKFAACAAHELRSPLTAIKLWLYEIRRSAGRPADVEHGCQVLEEEVGRLEELATSFLRFSKPPKMRLAVEDMTAILDRTLELAQPRLVERGIKLVRVNGAVVPPIMADANQLRQVLLNLIGNAADATRGGGEVRVIETSETGPDGRAEVVIRVQDDGPGIAEEVRERLFEPFVTTKPHGTGLGLAVSASIVSQHGGRLALDSTGPPGTVFSVRIPARAD